MSALASFPIPVSFFDDMPVPTLLLNQEGEIIYGNWAAQKDLRWSQLAGKTPISVWSLLSATESLKLQNALAAPLPQEKGEVQLTVPSGKRATTYTVKIACHPIDSLSCYLLSFLEMGSGAKEIKREITSVPSPQNAEATQEALLHHSAFVKHSIDGLFAFDLEMRYTLWNPYMEELTSKPKDQVLGNRVVEIFPYFESTPEYTFFKEALKGEYFQVNGRQAHHHPDKFHDGYLFPLQDSQQEIVGAMCILHEVTQQVRAEQDALQKGRLLHEAQTMAQTILSNSPVGIFTFQGLDLVITSWNQAIETISGIPAREIIGKSAFELYPEYRSSPLVSQFYRVLQGERLELRNFESKSGKNITNIYVVPLLDANGMVTGGLGHIQDVTAQVILEKKNALAAQDIQLAVMQAVLQAQEEEKKRMSEMIHNNLGQILYGTGMQLKQFLATQNLTKKHQNFLQELDGLVTAAVTETKKISFELMPSLLQDFGLGVALEELALRIAPPTIQIQICVGLPEKRLPPKLEICLYRIVQELMNNAIRYAQASQISVTIQRAGKALEVMVQDNGVGYEHPPKLKKGGTGLVTIQNRVNAQKGVWSVVSGPGKGTANHIQFQIKSQ